MAMELIETVEVGASGVTSIEFTNIGQDGKDLLILTSLRGVGGSGTDLPFNLVLNGTPQSANFMFTINNTSISVSQGYMGRGIVANDATSGVYGSAQIYISNYASTSAAISMESTGENNSSFTGRCLSAANYSGASGISQIAMNTYGTTDLRQYSSASLYKIY